VTEVLPAQHPISTAMRHRTSPRDPGSEMSFLVDRSKRHRYLPGVLSNLDVSRRAPASVRARPSRVSRLVVLCLGFALVACSKASATKRGDGYETTVLRYQAYPTMVGFPELAEDLGYLAPIKLKYVGGTISGPQNIQAVATGDVEFGGAFNGAIVKLIAAKAPIKAVIAYYGSDAQTFSGFYTLPGSPIQGAKDLIGKKIAVNTIGAHAEFSLREFLSRGGLTEAQQKQVAMVILPPANGEQTLREKQVDVAAMQTTLADRAAERGELQLLFSDYQLFGAFNAGSLVMTNRFIAENPNTVRKFIEATGKAIEWARNTPRAEVIERMIKVVHARNPADDTTQFKYWKTPTVWSQNGKLSDRDFLPWIDWLIKDGQIAKGQIQPRDLYTNEFQPKP
jgi:ABC-type nitrate/sulfonate/bicarbonate transport system substrate-binding protein